MIIVTGSSGLIGQEVVRQLRLSKVDTLSLSKFECDLASNCLFQYVNSLTNKKPTTVIHLAAVVPFGRNRGDTNVFANETNAIDLNVHRAASLWGAQVVYASTLALYDRTQPAPFSEDTPLDPGSESNYLKAKREGEQVFLGSRLNAVLRLPAPIGPGIPIGTVARLFIEKVINENSIEIWGTGKREQNYVDTMDIARSFINAATTGANGIFNISAPRPTSMQELATIIINEIGRGKMIYPAKPDPLEKYKASFSNEKARAILDWEPRITLSASIRRLVDSYETR